jgi:hypothetical protein
MSNPTPKNDYAQNPRISLIAVLFKASTKPWRPTATACKPSSSQKMAIAPIAKFKKKNDARNLEDHLQKTTTTNCNMPRQILIGAPMFTSTPAKKRQFPEFQL